MLMPLSSSGTEGLQRLLLLTALSCAGWYAARIAFAVMLVGAAKVRPSLRPWAVRCAPAALRPLVGRAVVGGLLSAALGGTTAWAAVDVGCLPDEMPALDRAGACAPAAAVVASPEPAGAPPGQSAAPSGQPSVSTAQHYVVRAGDSLWRISAGLLPEPADATAIARAWPLLWEANRDAIGDDPGLIRPGSELLVPAAITAPVAP